MINLNRTTKYVRSVAEFHPFRRQFQLEGGASGVRTGTEWLR